ncbi:adhesion G-protein coupled receptor G6-like isoform X2 [Ptychodera flava]|uniref:adhesion G-protein coupled receptor G6-like isoform X2 n=1 Tax=Ptychodera flava TaxID=63121 RepID=UPI003969E656
MILSSLSVLLVFIFNKVPVTFAGGQHCQEIIEVSDELAFIAITESLKWEDARYYCGNISTDPRVEVYIATLESDAERKLIRDRLNGVPALDSAGEEGKGYWIGCYCNTSSYPEGNQYVWVNMSTLSNDSDLWADGQPDGKGRGGCKECEILRCQMRKQDDYKLDDTCHYDPKPFICQIDYNKTMERPSLSTCLPSCSSTNREFINQLHCEPELTEDDKGIIFWPLTDVNITTAEECPYNNSKMAKRHCSFRCSADLKQQAVWEDPDTSDCLIPRNDADREDRLQHLADLPIPPGQASMISSELVNLTTDAETFDETELALTVDIIENILESGNSTEINVAEDVQLSVDHLLDVEFGVLVSSEQQENTSSRLIRAVDDLVLRVEFNNSAGDTNYSSSVTIETPNILTTAISINATTFEGLMFVIPSENQINFPEESGTSNGEMASSIQLPPSLFNQLDQPEQQQVERAQFVGHKLNTFFEAVDNSTLSEFSPVLAASIGEMKLTNLSDPVILHLAYQNQSDNGNISCVFWDFRSNDGNGAWSDEGCSLTSETYHGELMAVCECDHLTNFALLFDVYRSGPPLDPAHQKALSIISIIGCLISLLALAATLVTLICYRKTNDKATKILINLCFALFMALLFFLIGAFAIEYESTLPGFCTSIAVFLHYFLLAVMMWMALEAVHLYLMLVKVFEIYIRHFMIKFCLIGWGVPVLIVVITLAIDIDNYGYHNTICWLSDMAFYISFLAPFCLVLLFNLIVFCLIIYQICRLNSRTSTPNEKYSYVSRLRAAIALMVLLGLTWIFAFFAIGQASLLFNYLFAIFNSLQGLFIFVFHCAMKKDVRAWWKKIFCRCECCQRGKEHEATTSTNMSSPLKQNASDTIDKDSILDDSTSSVNMSSTLPQNASYTTEKDAIVDHHYHINGEAMSTYKRHSNGTREDLQ